MAYPRTAEHPDYTRAGARFIPEIWSGKILIKFYDATCLTEISNTDYEGEIKKYGDTVIIRTVAPITMRKYIVGQKLQNERPVSTPTSLPIDQGYYWNVLLNDVMDVQSDLNLLDRWTDEAGRQQKITLETDIFSTWFGPTAANSYVMGQTHASNQGLTAGIKSLGYSIGAYGSPATFDKANILDYIVDAECVLTEQNVPNDRMWMIIPVWMAGLIKKSDLKNASITGDSVSVMRNGRIGEIDMFSLYVSNLLPTISDGGITCTAIPFGHPHGPSFAAQLTETETLRSHDDFGDEVRGLIIYGAKILKTEAVGALYGHK